MDNETRDIVKGILKSCSALASNSARRSIKKTEAAFEQAERDKKEYEARQEELARQNWTIQYIQTTSPRLADIMAAVLSSELKMNIDALSVFCKFLYMNDKNDFVWDIDVTVGSSVNISTINSAKLIRHLNNTLDNIRLRAIADFSAYFNQAWIMHGASYFGQVVRQSYFAKNYLKLWQTTVTNADLESGVISLTVYLHEISQVGHFASWI